MEQLKKLYYESFFSRIICSAAANLLPELKKAFAESLIMKAWLWFNRVIINSALVKMLLDPEYISEIWYSSFFYRKMTLVIRKLSFYFPSASIKFSSMYVGIFLAILLLVPNGLWSDMFWLPLFGALALFYISRNIKNRTGTVFVLVNIILMLFLILIELSLPYRSIISIIYLLMGIDLFFLISFSLRTEDDLKNVIYCLFCAAALLCGIGFIQNNIYNTAASATFADSVSFGEILMLIFPFVFVYPAEFEKNPRKTLYMAFIFIAFFNTIMSTHSKAAFIGLLVELVILILCDIKYFPFLLLLMPLGLGSLIENFSHTIYATTSHGNIISNVINLFRRIWSYGFGVNSKKFMDIYSAAGLKSAADASMINLPYIKISPVYVNFIIDIGAVIMFGFLAYMLRLAHSALTLLFVGDKKYRRYFAAGLATLVAVSVSSLLETTIFESKTMLIYWAMLGILRSVRIMSFGVCYYDMDK